MDQSSIEKIVLNSVNALNLDADISSAVGREFVLFGAGALIDSLDLVSVITEVEEAISDEYGIEISLTDDTALSRNPSPYDSVGNLVDYICEVLREME